MHCGGQTSKEGLEILGKIFSEAGRQITLAIITKGPNLRILANYSSGSIKSNMLSQFQILLKKKWTEKS